MSPSWIDSFLMPSEGVPCLGVALGRKFLWASRTREGGGVVKVEGHQKVPLDMELFIGSPSPGVVSALSKGLAAALEGWRDGYQSVQVALPDPAVRTEVFKLDKIPAGGGPMEQFLKWRFQSGSPQDASSPLSFATQRLGEEGGQALLLGMAVDKAWVEAIRQAFREAGVFVSVIDLAACHRINFFHGEFLKKPAGSAFVTFDPEYWSLAVLDKEARLRFVRSKWWDKEIREVGDLPLEETMSEVERTIRAYVYGEKDRSVEALCVNAPAEWLSFLVERAGRDVEGGCLGLGMDKGDSGFSGLEEASPSALAAAVRR